MTDTNEHRGHCRCGSVVLVAQGTPDFSVYCHCEDCRRTTGAPVLASVGFLKTDVTWKSRKTLERYVNGTATRLFCKKCGSPVAQEHESKSNMIFINTAFMDAPEGFPPQAHTFSGDQLSWLSLNDKLPRAEKTLLINAE